jgi:hypothetical protein
VIHSIQKISLLVIILVGGVTVSAAAQDKGVDVTAAYQFQRISCCGSSTNLPAGFSVDAAGMVTPMLSWLGQVDLSRKSELSTTETLTSFAAGVRWSGRQTSGTTPFAQALVGAAHDSFDVSNSVLSAGNSVTKLLFDIDGGIAFPITMNKRISAVGEIGYRRIAEDPGLNGVRILLGVRFKVGS